jgi:S-formylglutathione hydrolase FrmB
VSEELPRLVAAMFPLSDRRGETFVAGLSMGGYGALKLALRQPGRFAAAASLSGATDARLRASRAGGRADGWDAITAAGLTRQALHAAILGFVHPVTGEALRFETAPPEDMRLLEEGLAGL